MSDTMTNLDERPKGRGRLIAITLVVILGVGAFVAPRVFGGGPGGDSAAAAGGPGEMPPMPVDVDTAREGNVVDAVRATGRIEAVQAVELKPDEPGRVVELLFREGQSVVKGTPLVKIDDALLRAQAERAEADRDLASQQLERVRRLKADNAASPADLERVEAAARSADAALGVLQLQIDRTTVRAPFSGTVGQRFISAGDYVTSATSLLTLQTTDPQRAVIEVPERYAADLRRGQEVAFTVAAHPGRTFRALVEFIDPVVQAEGRTILIKARAPNADQALKAGMFIEARLAVTTRSDAIVVPEDAVQPLRTANVVWAVVDGKASRRIVQLGSRSEGTVEILSGVQAGEQVVVGGLERMAEGMAVAPRPRGGAPADSATPPDSGAAPSS
jgi:membrane fusion protein (multidrug efflux system)